MTEPSLVQGLGEDVIMLAAGKLSSAAVVDGQVRLFDCQAEVNVDAHAKAAICMHCYGWRSYICPCYTYLLGRPLAGTQVKQAVDCKPLELCKQ